MVVCLQRCLYGGAAISHRGYGRQCGRCNQPSVGRMLQAPLLCGVAERRAHTSKRSKSACQKRQQCWMVRQRDICTGTGRQPRSILEAARLGRFRFSVLGVWRSLAVSRVRIDARLAEERKKSTPHPASPFASGIATKRWFFRLLTIRWRKLPRGKKNLLRNGPELREALVVQSAEFPGPRPDVRGPPSSAGFGILGFWVQAAPH